MKKICGIWEWTLNIKDGDCMNYYRIDYYSRKIRAYTYKIIKANTPEQAVKRARIKNIQEVTLVSMEK